MNNSFIINQNFLNDNLFNEVNQISKKYIENNIKEIYSNKPWLDTVTKDDNLPVLMYSMPQNDIFKQIIAEIIKKTGFTININEILLHFGLPNYHIPWHVDSNKTGITIFLNNDWDIDDGGLFLYKDINDHNNIKAIPPEKNTAIIVRNGIVPHAVSILSNKSKIRRTLQFFIDNSTINPNVQFLINNNKIVAKQNYNHFLYKLVHVSDTIIPIEICNEIIDLYENNKQLHTNGYTTGGINTDIKLSRDLMIPKKTEFWLKYEDILNKYIQTALKEYVNLYSHLIEENERLYVPYYQIQKYQQGEGHYKAYHSDFAVDYKIGSFRVITFIIYLNYVSSGGETEFMDEFKVMPSPGRIVLFPAAWPYIHKGNIPINNDKYIITGWFSSLAMVKDI